MPIKEFTEPLVGRLLLVKRKGSRSIRLSITEDGAARVSLPAWLPYQAGISFARSKADWIAAQREHTRTQPLLSGQAIGKAHHLVFRASPAAEKVTSRLQATEAVVIHPVDMPPTTTALQRTARQVAIRALRSETETLLPQRLRQLALEGGFAYKSVQIKQLKRRWGSCSQQKDIVLNLFIMQLPWRLIDYVLWHELTHTKELHHGPDFWAELSRHVPDAKQLRKQIRQYHTDIMT